jgi:hypothetical protein
MKRRKRIENPEILPGAMLREAFGLTSAGAGLYRIGNLTPKSKSLDRFSRVTIWNQHAQKCVY